MPPENTRTILRKRRSAFSFRWRHYLNVGFALLLLLPAIMGGLFLHQQVFPSNFTVSQSVPPRPTPGYFASFSSPTGREVAVLLHPNLRIIRVLSLDGLPLRSHVDPQKFAQELKIEDADGKFYQALVIIGDIDVEIGKLGQGQSLEVAIAARRGAARQVSLHFLSEEATEPPSKIKQRPEDHAVYIVGQIRSFTGPELFRNSLFVGSVMDLSGTVKTTKPIWSARMIGLRA